MPRQPATSPGAQGTAPQRDVSTAPQTDAQNLILPLHQGVGALHIEGQARVNPFDSTDTTVADLMTARPARVTGVRQPPVFKVTSDAVPHPQDYDFGAVTADGAIPGYLVVRAMRFTKIALSGTGTFNVVIGGSTVATATNSSGAAFYDISPALVVPALTVMDGSASGVTGSLYAVVME